MFYQLRICLRGLCIAIESNCFAKCFRKHCTWVWLQNRATQNMDRWGGPALTGTVLSLPSESRNLIGWHSAVETEGTSLPNYPWLKGKLRQFLPDWLKLPWNSRVILYLNTLKNHWAKNALILWRNLSCEFKVSNLEIHYIW